MQFPSNPIYSLDKPYEIRRCSFLSPSHHQQKPSSPLDKPYQKKEKLLLKFY